LLGGDGNDFLVGGDGNDAIDGNRGNDTAIMGAGNDTFTWDPGDGSDIIEGQDGLDTMVFNGAAAAEQIDISANGGRLRFFRNLGSIVMDADDLEMVNFNALGGADAITVNDLTGTDVTTVNVNLAVNGVPDGEAQSVIIRGTTGNDVVSAFGNAASASVI